MREQEDVAIAARDETFDPSIAEPPILKAVGPILRSQPDLIGLRRPARCEIRGKRRRGTAATKRAVPLGLRWPVERSNSWFTNFGQLRRNTDRSVVHRLAQLALAVTSLITAKLIDWRNRWAGRPAPIR